MLFKSAFFKLPFLLSVIVPTAMFGDARLTNLSVRSTAGSGAETLIVGFTLAGSGTKPVLLRGIGPSITAFNVAGAVADPRLLLFSGTTQIDQNDNWGGAPVLGLAFASVGAFPLTGNSQDAAMLKALPPGSYSALLDAGSAPGIALVECYDTENLQAGTYFTNVSARSVAGTGAKVLTVGFAISGSDAKTVLIRGIGPTLAMFGVGDSLLRPNLRLFNSAGTEIANTASWTRVLPVIAASDSVGAFPLPDGSNDAVLLLGLPAGTYTAQVRGFNNTSGTALIEVYDVTFSHPSIVTLQPVTASAAPSPPDPGAGTATTGANSNPVVLSQARPVYPFELRLSSITGEVLVDFYVKSDGTVGNAVAVRATDTRLAASAVTAVRTWTFVPARSNGRLVTTHLQVPIIYTLND